MQKDKVPVLSPPYVCFRTPESGFAGQFKCAYGIFGRICAKSSVRYEMRAVLFDPVVNIHRKGSTLAFGIVYSRSNFSLPKFFTSYFTA